MQELAALQPLGSEERLAEVLAAKLGERLKGRELRSNASSFTTPVEIRRSSFYTMLRYRYLMLRRAFLAIKARTEAGVWRGV